MADESIWVLLIEYLQGHWQLVLKLTWQHIYISAITLAIALVICIPLGIYLTKNERLTPYAIGLANVGETIPSLAFLAFLIPVVGIGNKNAIIVLVIYAILPILQNTYTGIKSVPSSLVQAARGVGMTEFQVLLWVQIPIAKPVIIAGIRVAAVWTIGTATLAAAIGGGGLGKLIFSGLAAYRSEITFAGAFPATILAIAVDYGLKYVQTVTSPEYRVAKLNKEGEVLSVKKGF